MCACTLCTDVLYPAVFAVGVACAQAHKLVVMVVSLLCASGMWVSSTAKGLLAGIAKVLNRMCY